tara:strand:- start:9634 stop:10272 length:639 start_codon:yes stop_codon:yes gene_type:complete
MDLFEFGQPELLDIFNTAPSKGMLKKIEIIEATIDCIATIGFEKTTYEAIAKQIGTRRAHIAYHFNDKQDIFKACVKYIVSNYHSISLQHLQEAFSPKDKLMKYIEGPYLWSEKYPKQLAVMLLFYYLCSVRDDYKELHDKVRLAGLERINDILLRDLQLEMSKREAKTLSVAIQNIMNGYHISVETSSFSSFKNAESESKKLIWKLVEAYL